MVGRAVPLWHAISPSVLVLCLLRWMPTSLLARGPHLPVLVFMLTALMLGRRWLMHRVVLRTIRVVKMAMQVLVGTLRLVGMYMSELSSRLVLYRYSLRGPCRRTGRLQLVVLSCFLMDRGGYTLQSCRRSRRWR